MPDLDTLKQHEQAFADLERDEQVVDRIILTREGTASWAIQVEGHIPMMAVPVVLRLIANLAEKDIVG